MGGGLSDLTKYWAAKKKSERKRLFSALAALAIFYIIYEWHGVAYVFPLFLVYVVLQFHVINNELAHHGYLINKLNGIDPYEVEPDWWDSPEYSEILDDPPEEDAPDSVLSYLDEEIEKEAKHISPPKSIAKWLLISILTLACLIVFTKRPHYLTELWENVTSMTGREIIDIAGALLIGVIVVFIFFRHLFRKENRWQLKVIILQTVVGLAAGYTFLWLFEDVIRNGVQAIFAFFGA